MILTHLYRLHAVLLLGLCLTVGVASGPVHPAPLELRDGDVVAFLGGTNMVRGQRVGHLEVALTLRHVKAKPRFRDMAWEGDTVFKQSTVAERWRKDAFGDWPKQLERVGATVVVAQFGQLESLRGNVGLGDFVEAYDRLLAKIEKRTKRVVLVSPTPFEKGPGPLRDPSARNEDLRLYVDATRVIAKRRHLVFVDVFQPLRDELPGGARLTSNGTHLEGSAHAMVAARVAEVFDASWKDDSLLRDAVVEKHRLWYDYWRPANWKCLFGDDGGRIFGKASGDAPSFREEWKRFPELIKDAEEHVWRVVDRDSIEAELSSFRAGEGLSVNLFASEADGIINPIAIRWDPRGRLWVACTIVYPQIEPGEKPGRVEVKEIGFHSLCAHHFLPFYGHVDVAYEPGDRILGLGKLPRLVDVYARRFQIQEDLVREVAGTMMEAGHARGVRVRARAQHLCMCSRGPSSPESITHTEFALGTLA